MRVSRVLETSLYTDDLQAADRFYSEVLGLQRVGASGTRHLFFRCGAGLLLIFDPRVTSKEQTTGGSASVPVHGAFGSGHVAFAVDEDELPDWRERLHRLGVAVEAEVEWPAGGRSIYFRDPGGNSIELAPPRIWGSALE